MPYQPLAMPRLTLNVEELSRTQVTVCLNQPPGAPYFNLEPLNHNNQANFGSFNLPTATDRGHVPASAYSVNFRIEQDSQGLVLRIFSSLNTSTEQSNPPYLPSCPVDLMGVDISSLWEYGGTAPVNPSNSGRQASYDSTPSSCLKLSDGLQSCIPETYSANNHSIVPRPNISSNFGDPTVFDFTSWISSQQYQTSCTPLPVPSEILLPPPPVGAPSPASSSSSCSTALSSDTRKSVHKTIRDASVSSTDLDNSHNRRFRCLKAECNRRFTSEHTLELHMVAHKPKPKPQFPCTLGCSERFSRQHDRLRHEVAQHGKICEWLCDECGRFFSSEKTLGIHRCPAAAGGTRWVK